MKHCPKCNTTHNKDGIFCSRSCANSRPSTEAKRLKQSNSAKNSSKVLIANASKKIDKLEKECTICKTHFYVLPCNSERKTCRKNCKSKQVALSNKGRTGGHREGSGRSNSGYYKGIYCGSTYELVWVIYRLDHNLSVTRFNGFIPYDNKKYFPDFIDGNVIYEMKGYHTEEVNAKTAAAIKLGYDVKVLYKENLKQEFEWVKNNYQYKIIEELYDQHKPKYIYECTMCNITFNANRKRIGHILFCSRICAGKYRAHIKHNSCPGSLDDTSK